MKNIKFKNKYTCIYKDNLNKTRNKIVCVKTGFCL